MGCFTQGWLCAPGTATNGAYHRYTRVNPHLHGELHTALPLELLRQPRYAPHDVECRVDGPSGIVFVRAWVPKVHDKPIAKMLGHPPIKMLDDLVAHTLHILDNLMQLF